jgi:hypothetical protein
LASSVHCVECKKRFSWISLAFQHPMHFLQLQATWRRWSKYHSGQLMANLPKD